LEIWNLVFMQFNQAEDGTRTPLPRPGVDTGLGLERLTSVVQQTPANYDNDLFLPAMGRVQQLLGDSDEERQEKYVGYRVIADHGRAATFLLADGVMPGNVGGGYVLRMIIRRAARFGRKIGFTQPFLADVASVFIDQMGGVYAELQSRREFVLRTLTLEEERFARSLDIALDQLAGTVEEIRKAGGNVISGETAFHLYATHGLPLEISRDVAAEWGMRVDETGFNQARADHAAASGAGAFGQYETGGGTYADLWADLIHSGRLAPGGVDHDPYGGAHFESEIVALMRDDLPVDRAVAGESIAVVTAATPFYIEAGGEVSDTGCILIPNSHAEMQVTDMRQPLPGLILHIGKVTRGEIHSGQVAHLSVDDERRDDIRRNHTATHILHRELRAHLGSHVVQAGSLVAPDRLRFDFTHDQAVGQQVLAGIEAGINKAILKNYPVHIRYMPQKEAIAAGAMALFGEKYGEVVRTIQIGGDGRETRYSFELCGGLHVNSTAEIGSFRFTSEGAVGAGLRRVEAVTGNGALSLVTERFAVLERAARALNAPVADVAARVETLANDHRLLQKRIELLQRQLAWGRFEQLLGRMERVQEVPVLAAQVEVAGADGLRQMADWFRDKVPSGVAVFGTVSNGKPLLVATVSQDLIRRGLKAGDIVRQVAAIVGGGGGGRADMAQAGGRDPAKLSQALAAVTSMVREVLDP
jgi:alanyl-tRNA synthetase